MKIRRGWNYPRLRYAEILLLVMCMCVCMYDCSDEGYDDDDDDDELDGVRCLESATYSRQVSFPYRVVFRVYMNVKDGVCDIEMKG